MKPTHSVSKSETFKKLTNEQGVAVISPSKSLKIEAPAGSGKTTLLMGYTYARRASRGLYLAFGKPTQEDANRRLKALGVKTISKTQHSLAWPGFGAKLDQAGKLQKNASLRAAVTANLINVNYAVAAAINESIRLYMCGTEAEVSDLHLPDEAKFPIVKSAQGQIIDGAKMLWGRMTNLSDKEANAVPDVYLKQWANTKPKLDYDFILFDECQDANPLAAALVNAQTHTTRVYVGDRNQSIYGFRGAVNLMDDLVAEETRRLTASFRFPHNIGLLATVFLRHWKGQQFPINGMGPGGKIESTDQQAYLSRTVAGLIAKGFELHSKGRQLHWVKGFEDYKTTPILEAYDLFKGKTGRATDPVLKLMRSWTEFGEYVESTGDGEAGPVFRLVEKYRDEIPNIIETLRTQQVKNGKEARYVLTTAHKSKGLEWPVVRLTEDFFSLKDDKGKWKKPADIDPQEANLMYVALTRAEKAIAPTKEVAEWFRTQAETKHLFPESKKPEAPAPQLHAEDVGNCVPQAA